MARRLRILAIIPSAYCFGLQNVELGLFAHLRRDMDCHFLTTRWTDGEFERRLDALGIPHTSTWLGMFSRRLDWRNVWMTLDCLVRLPVAWRDFVRLYRSLRPDIVYLANYHEAILLLPLLYRLRRRVVCHMHDPPPAIAFQKITAWCWRRCIGRFLFISRSVRDQMARVMALRPGDEVIHNGVAIAPLVLPRRRTTLFRDRFAWPEDCVIIGLCGQISADKGHADFIEAAAIAHRLDSRLRFVIGGRGAAAFVADLERLIAEHHLAGIVEFSGWLADVNAFYEAVDVVVLASRHDEGFGLVVAEAGERGLSVIATRSGGAVEVAIDGATAMVIDKRAPRAMAEVMVRLAADSALRDSMGRAGRVRVAASFDLAQQADRMARLLKDTADAAAAGDAA